MSVKSESETRKNEVRSLFASKTRTVKSDWKGSKE